MGREERRNRKRAARAAEVYKEPSVDLYLELSRRVRSGLEALGVTLNRSNALEALLQEVEWLATISGPDSAVLPGVDQRRATLAFMRVQQAETYARLLERGLRVKDRDKFGRWLRGQVDRIEKQGGEPQEHLLQLEIAGLLAREEGFEVEAESEPDISVQMTASDGERLTFGVAVKRPRGLSGVEEAIRKARRQVEASPHKGGIILLEAEAILHPPAMGPEGRPAFCLYVETPDEAFAKAKRVLVEVGRVGEKEIRKAFMSEKKRIFGVRLQAFVSYFALRIPGNKRPVFGRESIPRTLVNIALEADLIMSEFDRMLSTKDRRPEEETGKRTTS